MIRTDIEYVGRIPVARPLGDLDVASAQFFHDDLAHRLGPDADVAVLDLAATRYVDSAGIDMLLRLNDRLRQRRATLRLVVPPDSPLQRLFDVVGLRAAIAVHDNLDDALNGSAPRSPAGAEPAAPPLD